MALRYHSRAELEEMLRETEAFAALGAEHIRAQEARVAALEKGRAAAHTAKKLLETMKQTQDLHEQHVLLLKRELAELG